MKPNGAGDGVLYMHLRWKSVFREGRDDVFRSDTPRRSNFSRLRLCVSRHIGVGVYNKNTWMQMPFIFTYVSASATIVRVHSGLCTRSRCAGDFAGCCVWKENAEG